MQQPPQQQQPPPQMQQRIQMPQPSPGPVMYAAPSMDMNGYAAVYSYQAAFQQPPPQQFIQAEQAYQNSSQFNMPPPGMYSAAQAAQAYQQRPPPQQQQTFYAALPHPSMMQHQEQQRNPFMAPGKHCLSVFDTPAESSAAYTASWVSSTSSIPPEQKASPDQESNPPTPSEYSNNWHENNVHRASPLVDEFAAGASATSGFSPPLGDNTLDAQLASLNISHADFTATINGKGPMPSGFYGARTVNAPQMHQNQGIPMHHSMAPPQMGQASYLTTAAMYYQSGPPQPHNANYYVANQPPPTQHVVDVSGNTWADMVKKGGNCSVGETRIRQMQTQRQDSMSQNQGNQGQGHPGHNGHNRRFNRRQNPGGNNCYQNGRNNFNNQQNLQQNARKNRMERMDRNSQEQFGSLGGGGNPKYNPSHSPSNAARNGGNANNPSAPNNNGQNYNYPPPYYMSQGGMNVPPPSTSAPTSGASNNQKHVEGGFRSTWLDEHLPALDLVIHDNAMAAQAIVQEKMLKNKGGATQFVVPPPAIIPSGAPGNAMHRFLTPGAFGMTAFIPMCPQNYQHSSSPPQGQMNRQRRNFNGQQQQHNGRNRPYRPHALEESDRDKAECATVDSEKTVQAENEDAGDSGTKEEQ